MESFAVPPETPLELINAIDYLVRVGLEDQAIPLAEKLLDADSDDETLYAIGQNVGSSKILSLQSTSDATLNELMARFSARIGSASKRVSTDADRIRRLIDQLSASSAEREIAIERLSRLGSESVNPLIAALSEDGITAQRINDIQRAMNQLESSAVPALIGALRHPDPKIRVSVAQALGSIGDLRALPWLVHQSTKSDSAGTASAKAVSMLSRGRSIENATRFLTSESSKYLDRDVFFIDSNVVGWFWNEKENRLSSLTMPSDTARGAFGYRLARMALETNPEDPAAQAIAISTLIDEESRRLGGKFPAEDPIGVWPIVLSSGPQTVSNILKRALITGRHENIAALTARALGQITTSPELSDTPASVHLLVQALDSPDRRVQFEASKAIFDLAPERSFAGSSRVFRTMSRFLLSNPQAPRAIVIHDNVTKGGDWVGYLRSNGYDAVLETSANDGFNEAARRGDVELVLLSTFLDPTGWALHETVSNFQADSRTTGIPMIVVGPLDAKTRLGTLLSNSERLGFMVDPVSQDWFDRQLTLQLTKFRHSPLSRQERNDFRDEALKSLGRVSAKNSNSPMAQMLETLEPQTRSLLVSTAIDSVEPISDTDRGSLIRTILSKSSPIADRTRSAELLAIEFRKSGMVLSSDDRSRLLQLFTDLKISDDKRFRESIGTLVGLCKPTIGETAKILINFAPGPAFYDSIVNSR